MGGKLGRGLLTTAVLLLFVLKGGEAQQPIELIVRGDDMGWSHDTNLSIVKAYKEGILTSASVQVCCLYSDDAFALCKTNPGLAAGVHVTLWDASPTRPVLPYEEIPRSCSCGFAGKSGFCSRDMRERFPSGSIR